MGYPIYHSQYTAAQIEASLGKTPRIKASTRTWEIWDIATSQYVDTGVSIDTQLFIDPTLTESGYAADAKVTGDAVSEIKSIIRDNNSLDFIGVPTQKSGTHNGVTYTFNSDYSQCSVSGTATSLSFRNLFYNNAGFPDGLSAGDTCYIRYKTSDTKIKFVVGYYVSGSSSVQGAINFTADGEYTIPSNAVGLLVRLSVGSGDVISGTATVSDMRLLNAKTNKELTSATSNSETQLDNLQDNNSFNIIGVPFQKSGTHNGITYTFNGDYSECTVNGTSTASSFRNIYFNTTALPDGVKTGEKYQVRYATSDENVKLLIGYFVEGSSSIAGSTAFTENGEYTVPSTAVGLVIRLTVDSGKTINNAIVSKYKLLTALTNEELTYAVSDVIVVPRNYKDVMESVIATAQETPADLRFLVFTDPHNSIKERYQKYKYFMEKYGCVDALVCLGDTMDYVEHGLTKAYATRNLTDMLTSAGRKWNHLYVVGNHDVAFSYANNGPLSPNITFNYKEMFDFMNRHLNHTVVYDEENPYGGYYYTDFDAQKTRVIVLNTSDIFEADGQLLHKYSHSVMFHQRQITWLATIALDLTDKETPTDWHILVCQHARIDTESRNGIVTDILNAVKNGNSLDASWTIKRRLTYDAGTGEYTSVIDTSESDALVASKDYSAQGEVDVIGVLLGHTHCDNVYTSNGIKMIEFGNDNPTIYKPYMADISGLSAGDYSFTDSDNVGWGFTASSNHSEVVKLAYNDSLKSGATLYVYGYDEDGNTAVIYSATKTEYSASDTVINFTNARLTAEVKDSTCYLVSINTGDKTLKKLVFGAGIGCDIEY